MYIIGTTKSFLYIIDLDRLGYLEGNDGMIRRIGKKLMVGLLASTMLLGSSSAFAYDGWADSLPDAYSLNGPISGVSTTINSSADVDWFKWTAPSSGGGVSFNLQSPVGLNYDFHVIYTPDGVNFYSLGSPSDNGASAVDSFGTFYYPGETFYIQVRGQTGSDYSPTALYTFNVIY